MNIPNTEEEKKETNPGYQIFIGAVHPEMTQGTPLFYLTSRVF